MRINMNNVPEKGRLGNKNPNWKGGKKMNSVCGNCGKEKLDYKLRISKIVVA